MYSSQQSRGSLSSGVADIKRSIVHTADEIKEDVRDLNTRLRDRSRTATLGRVGEEIGAGVAGVAGAVEQGARAVGSGALNAAGALGGGALGAVSQIAGGAAEAAGAVSSGVAQAISAVGSGVGGAVEAVGEGVGGALGAVGHAVRHTTRDLASPVRRDNVQTRARHDLSADIAQLIAGAGGAVGAAAYVPQLPDLPPGARVLPLVHQHDGQVCPVAQRNQQVLREREAALREAEQVHRSTVTTRVEALRHAEEAYQRKLQEARNIVAQAEQAPTPAQRAAELAPIDAQLQEKRARLQQEPTVNIPELDTARRAWRLAQEEYEKLRRVALPDVGADSLQEARRRLREETDRQLRALDAEEARIRSQALLPASVSVNAQTALQTLQRERALLQQQYTHDLAVIDHVRRQALDEAAARNAEAERAIQEASAKTQQAIARLRALEDQYHAVRTQAERARVEIVDAPKVQALQQARAELMRLIDQRNNNYDDSLARHRWEVEEALRRQQFELDELSRVEQFRLAEERRLSQYRLNNTKVDVSADIPIQTVRMQPGMATREVTRLMPVKVLKQVPVQVPVVMQDTMRVDSVTGRLADTPFEPRQYAPAQYEPRQYTAPARPAPLPLPVEREEVREQPHCVDVALERTVFEEKVIPVTEKVLKPVVAVQEQQVVAPLETVVRKEFVVPVKLADVSVAALDNVVVQRVTEGPVEVRAATTTHASTDSIDHSEHIDHHQQRHGIFGGLRRLFGGSTAAASFVEVFPKFSLRSSF